MQAWGKAGVDQLILLSENFEITGIEQTVVMF